MHKANEQGSFQTIVCFYFYAAQSRHTLSFIFSLLAGYFWTCLSTLWPIPSLLALFPVCSLFHAENLFPPNSLFSWQNTTELRCPSSSTTCTACSVKAFLSEFSWTIVIVPSHTINHLCICIFCNLCLIFHPL